jgi:hypothetical protein
VKPDDRSAESRALQRPPSLALERPPIRGARAFQASAAVLAVVFIAFHLPYLPSSLEDLDSINFALGVRQFDVARHQPHPPGYPVYIVIAKAIHTAVPAEATALGLLSAIAGGFGVLAMAVLFRRLNGAAPAVDAWPLTATAVAMTAPLYWVTAVRPLSDMSGFAAALAVQAMTLGATSARALALAGFCAGLACGLRSQIVWLTVPLLIVRGLGARRLGLAVPGVAVGDRQLAPSTQRLAPTVSFIAGVLLWFAPLVAITGGPAAYWRALSNQGAEDLGNIQMLWTRHAARDVADALYYAFVAPWAAWPVAIVVLVCVALGAAWLYRHARRALVLLAAAFGPYLIFDLLFQETFTSRYALPLVVPAAYLAVSGLRMLPRQSGVAVAVAIAMFDAHVGGTSIAAYARQHPPAFRLLDDMRSAARLAPEPPVLAMDRRNAFDFRRPIAWLGDDMPRVAQTLLSPPQHEWLEAVKYWNSGGRAPVWFVVDPMRTSIDLVQHGRPSAYRWPLPYPVLVSGARPNEMDWYRVERPEWYVGEGWALTPEAAGVAEADGHDLGHGPISGWINRRTFGGLLMIGGRSFEPTLRPRLSVLVDGRSVLDETLMPGPFLFFAPLPRDLGASDYARLAVTATVGPHVAIEQFDVSAERPLAGFGDGWHEQEFNPRTGLRWRWLSERGELRLRTRAPRLTLHLEGESPRTYFSRGSRVVVRAGDRVVFDDVLAADFSLDVPIDTPGDTIVLETDQVYVPADRSRRTQDRRHLGLRMFKCEIRRP